MPTPTPYTYSNNKLELYKRVNGIWTSLTAAAPTISDNTYYHYRVVVSGTSIKVYFNNSASASIDITDNTFGSGKIGLRTGYSQAKFDNVFVMQ